MHYISLAKSNDAIHQDFCKIYFMASGGGGSGQSLVQADGPVVAQGEENQQVSLAFLCVLHIVNLNMPFTLLHFWMKKAASVISISLFLAHCQP